MNYQLPNVGQSSDHNQSRIAITDECDFPGVETITALKSCITYDYCREAAREGYEPARLWLIEQYPGWDSLPWKMVPVQLRQERTAVLAQQEVMAAVSQLVPDTLPDDLLRLGRKALACGKLPFVTIPPSATALQLAKIEGLTLEKYLEFINSKRAGIAKQIGFLEFDWSLHDEAMVDIFRCLLRIARPRDAAGKPLQAIDHGKGQSSTIRQLRVILKALVVRRLLGRGGLSITGAVRKLQDAGLQPPFSQNREQRWRNAELLALHFLRELKAGRFVETVQSFVATRQARKIFLP